MKNLLLLVAILFLGSLLSAQTPVYFKTWVSPRGTEFFEGNSSSGVMFTYANTRTQQVDNYLVGQKIPLVRGIGWRRNGGASSAVKSPTVTITMAHADMTKVTNAYASNYKGPATTAFSKKVIKLADWSANITGPAPFDLIIPFDKAFIYNGQDAILWEVVVENNTTTPYNQDWCSGTLPHTYGAYPDRLGSGCRTPNGIMAMECACRAAASMEMGFRLKNAPSSTAVLLLLGYKNLNLTLPGLCTTLYPDPIVTIALGTSDATGNVPLSFPITTTWDPALAGAVFYMQAMAADTSQPGFPVALSHGLQVPAPLTNASALPIDCWRIYNMNSATATTGSNPSNSSVPTIYCF